MSLQLVSEVGKGDPRSRPASRGGNYVSDGARVPWSHGEGQPAWIRDPCRQDEASEPLGPLGKRALPVAGRGERGTSAIVCCRTHVTGLGPRSDWRSAEFLDTT